MKRSDIEFRNALLFGIIALNIEGSWKIFFCILTWLYASFYFIEKWKENKTKA